MNKLLTFPGVQPIYLGDIDFFQESVQLAFKQLLVGLTGQDNPNCILKKATKDKDGVICLNGEIMPYKPYTGDVLGSYYYEVKSSYTSERTFKNGEKHKCHEERYAQEVLSINSSGVPTFDDLLFRRLKFDRFAMVDDDDRRKITYSYIKLGTSLLIEISIEFAESMTLEYLFDDDLVNIPSAVASQPNKYCNLSATVAGSLVNIPASVSLRSAASSDVSHMTVKINKTTFNAGDAGTLNLQILV